MLSWANEGKTAWAAVAGCAYSQLPGRERPLGSQQPQFGTPLSRHRHPQCGVPSSATHSQLGTNALENAFLGAAALAKPSDNGADWLCGGCLCATTPRRRRGAARQTTVLHVTPEEAWLCAPE